MRTPGALAAGIAIVSLAAGWWARDLLNVSPGEPSSSSAAPGPCPGGAEPLYWKAPMDPTYVRDRPGKSPMGMDLVPECPGAADPGSGSQVAIDSATIQKIGVRTMPVARRDLSRSVRAVGRVAYDERRVAHVHTKVQGWVERLLVNFVGQAVERGEPLLEIYSPELVATQEELLLAARYRDATGESPFEDVRVGGESLFSATKRRLALWDIPERDIERLLRTGQVQRTLTLYAPVSGVVTELGVRSGMEVEPNANLYTIADLSHVWVLADVYEYELPWLEVGQKASVELSYLPGEPLRAELTYIAPFLDPQTRTAEVRLELDNADGALKPEMFGTAVIEGTPRPDTLAVPSEAVIRSGKRTIAIVSLGQGRFEPREIELGLETGEGWVEVLDGVREEEPVVVSSQFLIDSESKLREAVRKLLAAEGAPATAEGHDHGMGGAHEMPEQTPAQEHEHHGHHEMAEPPPAQEHEHHEMSEPPPAQEHRHHGHHEMSERPPAQEDEHRGHHAHGEP